MQSRVISPRLMLLPGLCAGLLLCGRPALGAPDTGFTLPPLTQGDNTEHHVGKVVWVDLITPDLARAEQFYAGLLNWSFAKVPGDANYVVATLDGEPVAGLFNKPMPAGQHRQPAWLTFIAARDVDAIKQMAVAHGAKVLSQPKTYPQRGRQAVFADPDGAVFAVLASSSGDPPDYLAAPGEWIWSSLLVHDADHEAAFYQTLFGYDVFDLASEDSLHHLILSSDDFARTGVNELPRDSVRRHPHWLNFVRVVDATATAAKAVALGGQVLVEPRVDRHGGKLAVIADPNGAPFGVMEWSQDDTKQEPK
jgi:uncharacterized protein